MAARGQKAIVLEFNELVPEIVDRFIQQGKLPNFARLRSESIVAITDAEEAPPRLEPWIQWVTVHTGLSFSEHKVFDLDDGKRLQAPRIWDLVSDAGKSVWICGSMNAGSGRSSLDGYVMPDPWASEVTPVPKGFFEPYLDLVRTYVQQYTSDRPDVTKSMMFRFGRFMLKNGLSLKTVSDILRQLTDERRNDTKWRRAVIMDRLQWDVFRSIYQQGDFALSTFFLNSTAHFQHYYWRNMEPEAFAVRSSDETQRKYADAILFGYQKMDEIIGEAFELAGPDTSIILCTALSQQPMLTHENSGGKQMFKPTDHARLFAFAGVSAPYQYAPVMAQQFRLVFDDEATAIDAQQKVAALRLDDGTPLMLAKREGNRLFSGCNLEAWPAPDAQVLGDASNEAIPFTDLFYPLEAVRSGMHHPDGILWIRTPERAHHVIERKISLTEIAPTLLPLAGVRTDHRFSSEPLAEVMETTLAAA